MGELDALRREIDALDRKLIDLLAQRFRVVGRVVAVKSALDLPARIPERIAEVIASREAWGLDQGLPPDAAGNIWSAIVEETCRAEERVLRNNPAGVSPNHGT